jgi:D-alanyl-lipoteichoic acid acyltransferase DltB (MBOAT superfamily)
VFYAAWNPPFLLLLIGSTTLDWWIAQRIDAAQQPRRHKLWVSATLLINLCVLAFFKYNRFLLDNFAALLGTLGVHYIPARMDIVLPIGISFYTFHSLSYCIDIYRRKFAPTQSWRDYAFYVAFSPQLVAGPITCFSQMRERTALPPACRRRRSMQQMSRPCRRFGCRTIPIWIIGTSRRTRARWSMHWWRMAHSRADRSQPIKPMERARCSSSRARAASSNSRFCACLYIFASIFFSSAASRSGDSAA